ncbi:MAG: hypothetical protein H0T79_12100 [Deltaproteobacteria bacterium]|nr:hypothetical protein [Deltaproteobacteria bacterium]
MRARSPKALAAVQKILASALLEVEPSRWPERRHLGGPFIVLSTRSQLAVAVALSQEVRRLLPPIDQLKEFDAMYAVAKRVSDGESCMCEELHAASKPSKKDAPATRVVKLAIRTAANYLYSPAGARNAVGTAVENAAASVVPVLAERGVADLDRYFAWLDDEIMRQDLTAVLADRELRSSSSIARVLSRPVTDKGTLGLAVARLADGPFGLYVKLRSKWEWHEGDKATVFATVPDHFQDAVSQDLAAVS